MSLKSTRPIVIPSEDDLKYITGIYEGEGSCGAYLAGYGKYALRRPQLELRIEMYDKDIIEWVSSVTGGNLTPRKRAAQISYNEPQLLALLKAMLPHMKGRRRREQTAKVFKLYEMKQQRISRKDDHQRRVMADLAGEINSYNYGGGHRSRRDYTHTSKPLAEDIVQSSAQAVVVTGVAA